MVRKRTLILLAFAAVLVGWFGLAVAAEDAPKPEQAGREVAFNRTKGNCLTCHAIPGDPKAESAGNVGPPLVMMKARYPERAKLRAQIWDATQANPRTAMPPFGKHQILTEQEVDQVVDYVYSL